MPDKFEKQAAERAAKLDAAQTAAAQRENAAITAAEHAQQHMLKKHVPKLEQEARAHQNNLDGLAFDAARTTLDHEQARRQATMQRQLGAADTMVARDMGLHGGRANAAVKLAEDAEQAEQDHVDWAADTHQAQRLNALSSHQALAANAHERKLQTALKGNQAVATDIKDSAKVQDDRNTRREGRAQRHESGSNDRTLEHTHSTLETQAGMAAAQHNNALNLAKRTDGHESTLMQSDSTLKEGHDTTVSREQVRHERRADEIKRDKLLSAQAREEKLAGSDFNRVKHRAHADETNDASHRNRRTRVNKWASRTTEPEADPTQARTARDLAAKKEQAAESLSANNAHVHNGMRRDRIARLVSKYLSSTRRASQAETSTQVIDNTHEQELIRQKMRANYDARNRLQAEKEQRKKASIEPKKPKTDQHEQTFENGLDALNFDHPTGVLNTKARIAGRSHDHVRTSALIQDKNDVGPRVERSERNKTYASNEKDRQDKNLKDNESRELEKGREALGRQEKKAKMSHDAARDNALHHQSSSQKATRAAARAQQLKNDHLQEETTNKETRKQDTDLKQADRTLDDKAAIRQSVHHEELGHAQRLSDIDSTQRQHNATALETYNDRQAEVEQGRLNLSDKKVVRGNDQRLNHKHAEAAADFSNNQMHAHAHNTISSDVIRKRSDAVIARTNEDATLDRTYEQDAQTSRLKTNEDGVALYTRHAKEFYDEKLQEALGESNDKSLGINKKRKITEDHAKWSDDIERYELNIHAEAAVTLAHMQERNQAAVRHDEHDALRTQALESHKQRGNAIHWDADRIVEKASSQQSFEETAQRSQTQTAIDKTEGQLAEQQRKANALLNARGQSAQGHATVEGDARVKKTTLVTRVTGKYQKHDETYNKNTEHQGIDTAHHAVNAHSQEARDDYKHWSSDKLGSNSLEADYAKGVRQRKSRLEEKLRKNLNDHESHLDNLLSELHDTAYSRRGERTQRDARLKEIDGTIKANNADLQKFQKDNIITRTVSNYEPWFEKLGLLIDESLDSLKDSVADLSYNFSVLCANTAFHWRSAKHQARHELAQAGAYIGSTWNGMKLSVSNMTDTVRDAAARLATGISQFFSRNTTAILTYLGYKAKRAQVVTDEYITPIGDNLKATAKDAAVTATLASDIATQEVVSPVRSFGITAKASIKAAGTGVARWVKSSWSATVAGFKSFTNGLYTGVAQMGTSVRNFFTGFVNAVKNNWREMTRGWGKATRKARHTVVLPSKKGVANAEKQRQSGLAFILSRPAAWWRAAKHELSVLSWKASAKTYEPRAAVKNAYASVGRNGKYAWGRAGNAVTYHAKGLYISVGSTLSAWFASLGYAGRAAVGTTSKVRHAVSEAAPNPTDALEAASLAVQSVYSEAARVTSTTSNNLSAGVKATASQAVHALHKPARPAREKGGKLKNKTLHQKDKGVDAATAAGEGLLNTGVLGVALAGGALLSAHAKLKGGAQAVVAAAGQFVAVTGSVVGVMLVNPAQAGWRQAKQSGAHAAYLTVYRLGDTGQTIKDGVSSALAAPGRVASWTTLNVTNALDDALPGAYYALARTGLTVNYYGAVACDGMVYAAQVTGNAVMVPVRFVAETLVDGADTMVAQAKQLGYQTDLVSGKASTAIQVTAQTKWAAFFNAAAPVIYDFGDAIFNVQTTALHLTSDAANSVRGNVRDIGYAVRSGGHVAWDAMNDTGARVMFYVKIVGVSMLAVPVRGAFNTTHAVNSAGSALQSGFGTVSQALSYRVNQAGTAIFYAGSQLNEARKNRRAVIIEGVSYGLSGHWDGAQYVANQASAQVRYALGGLYNPFARLKAFFQKAGYIFNQKGHTACFAVIQGADVAGMAVIDVVPDVAQAARFAVEGCGDAVILAAKGVQVSAGNACGEAAVTVQTKGASGLHSLGKQKDALAFAAKDAGARLAVEAQNTGTQVGVAAGQLKDDMVEPVARVKDSVVHTAKEGIEHVRHAGVNTWQQGKQGVQSSGMVLTSAASQTFNTTVDQTVIAWQKARAEVGKKFDNGLEHLHKNYHVDYMRKPATS